jgi:hypothetical protein
VRRDQALDMAFVVVVAHGNFGEFQQLTGDHQLVMITGGVDEAQ